MQRHSLDISCEEEFLLIAIHCNEEEHKLAFLINKSLKIKLMRRKKDLDFFSKEGNIAYPIFEYFDTQKENVFFLVNNRCKTITEETISAGGSLFETNSEEKTHYLIPEYKKTDYFLKIVSDDISYFEIHLLPQLTKLPYVITAYAIDYSNLKSKNNLNFD